MIKYIIFDFDGTIADTYPHIVSIVNTLRAENNLPYLDFNKIKQNGIQIRNLIKYSNIPSWKIPTLVYRVLTELKNRADFQVFPEIINVLKILNKKYKLGLISSNTIDCIRLTLKKHKIASLFKFIYSDSPLFGKHKTLKIICKKLNLSPNQVLYIGDEDRDIQAAKKVGIKIIAVSWGYNSEEMLRKKSPNYLVSSPRQLLNIIS